MTYNPGGNPDPNQPNQGGQNPWAAPGQGPPPGQYGQPPYGPPQYGQPQYGPPPYGQYPPAPPAGYGYGPGGPAPGAIASMGSRFGGLVIDTLLLGVVSMLLGLVLGSYHQASTCDASGSCSSSYNLSANWTVDLLVLALGMAYGAYFVGIRGQSLGHMATGIRVVNVNNGRPIGPWRGALRWLVLSVSGALCTVGYWSPFFDPSRRGWHDMASSSIVVRAR